MISICSQYHVEYYRQYDRSTLERARLAHQRLLERYQGGDGNRIATLAWELGAMDAEVARRDDLARQGAR